MTYVIGDAAFIGDTLFMPDYGTARADFPGGDARQLYRSIRKVLSLVQGVLGRAVVLGRIRANPVVPIRKPVQGRRRAVRPLTPTKVERLRRLMPTDQDATLVSVLAYAGLRPGEALALTWADVGERTILVERSVALGEVKETKTRSSRGRAVVSPETAAALQAHRARMEKEGHKGKTIF